MRKSFLIIFFLAFYLSGFSQQQPQYTQYIINNYILNPALSGIENYTDIKISHRHQWIGLQDAPVTTYITISMPLGKKDDRITATSFKMPGENPRGTNYWQDYTSAAPHSGIGLKIINDKTGPLNTFSAYASYAYHMGISPQTSIAAGFELGVRNISLNASALVFDPNNPISIDPAIGNSGSINSVKPDMGAGIWVYSADYFIGLSAQQIIPQTIYFSGNTVKPLGSRLVPHLFASAGYRFQLTEDISALPSVMMKIVNPTPAQFDLNFKLQYQDFLWVGGSYRTGNGFAGMAGMNISNTFNVSYAYDYTTSLLGTVSKGTHEIVLGFLLGNRYDDSCPRNIW
ncbi:MAG: type IX secretion system membrane protein PorP/SprF [Ginsengibacter sp.]|jgi:type IX secretion system PorP/SprF family membrane protein